MKEEQIIFHGGRRSGRTAAMMDAIISKLQQGDKVRFKWHGSDKDYIGRIQIKDGVPYFVGEHNYENDEIKPAFENIRYYNTLKSFAPFTEFHLL